VTRYEDRGNLKWIPFLMPEHAALLREYYVRVQKLEMPAIDEQLKEWWARELEQALIDGTETRVIYFEDGGYRTASGFVEQVREEEEILVIRSSEKQEIPLARIIRIETG